LDPTPDPALALADNELADISRPLRETPIILIMSANPKDDLRLDEEMREIRTELEKTEFGRQFQLELRPATIYKDLQRYVAETTPTILHFSGHGDVPGIMLEDERGKPYLVPGTALATLLSLPFIKDQLRLVVLNACLSETQARMIAQEIDVVVGMASNVGDEAAINFARGLYSGLGMGRDVASAFALGTNAIEIADLPEEQTPQMIVREGVDASRIMPLAASGPGPQTPPAATRFDLERLKRRPVIALVLVLGTIIGGVAAVMGGLATILGSIDTIARRLGIVSDPAPPAEEFGAEFATIELGARGVPLATVAQQNRIPSSLFTDEQLASLGQMVAFTVNTLGLVGKTCQIVWSVFTSTGEGNLAAVPDSDLWTMTDATAFPTRRYKITAINDAITDEVWVPYSPEPGRFVAELRLRDVENPDVILARGRTAEFSRED
jgi:hypothetical protein